MNQTFTEAPRTIIAVVLTCLALAACGDEAFTDTTHVPIQGSFKLLDKQVVVSLSTGCTGTLITNNWVLTAAHCVDGKQGNPASLTVTGINSVKAAEIHMHPSFMVGYGKLKFWNYKSLDIALVRLSKSLPVDGSYHKHRMRLHAGSPSSLVGQEVVCYGYGNTSADPANDKWSGGGYLQVAAMSYGGYGKPYLSLSPNGTNQVQLKGDSGGPCIHAVSGGGLRLAGVQSWVSWNGGGVNKSYQTSVSIIRDWVAQVTMQHDVEIAHSGKCLRVASYSKSNFALVEQRTCNNGGSQRWRLVPVPLGWYPGGYSEVYQIVNVNSGRCLDVRDGKTTNGAVVQQYGCHGGTNQMWTLKRIGSSDRWEVHSVKGGKCLDVTNFSKADGAKLQMWSCHGGKNQQFRFRGFLAGGFEYELAQAKAPGTCADVQGWSKGNMADVQTYSCHEGANQRWSHAMVSGNAHRLRNVNSYKCLDVANFSKSSGANVQQYACHAGANQKWDFYYTGKGYHIKNRHSGKCLQPVGGSVKQAWCYTTSTQRWRPRF